MGIGELLLMGAALASDAFAVSVCAGLGARKNLFKTGLACGAWFGFFQALMPLIGWMIGSVVSEQVERFAPYIAFTLLSLLGAKMIIEARRSRQKSDAQEEKKHADLKIRTMLPLAVATSIDALAAGITFAALHVHILYAIALIGLITFFVCQIGTVIGAWVGGKIESQAQTVGGLILIAIGIKILAEHIFVH